MIGHMEDLRLSESPVNSDNNDHAVLDAHREQATGARERTKNV
jgi:hypothetical protein